MFTSLLTLYRTHSSRTPLERFSCEVFCGLLKAEPSLLNVFLRNFTNIDGEKDFSISTEKTYHNNGKTSRIDIVIENANHLIFIEAKVNSNENNKSQLTEYKDILEQEKEKQTSLLYLTKYLEIKNPKKYTPIPFKQFLWRDVYTLADQEYAHTPSTLIREFLSYLESQDMNKAPEFTIEDIAALRRLHKIIHSMDECLHNSKETFIKLFGEPDTKFLEADKRHRSTEAEALHQFIKYNRHAMKRKASKHSIIGVFINFGNSENTPQIEVQLWMDNTDKETFERFEKSLSILAKHKPPLNEHQNQWGMGVNFREHLSKFIDDKEQFEKIKNWTNEKLKIFHQYMSESKKEYNIPWDFK